MPFKTLAEFLSLFGEYQKTSSGRYKVRCKAHSDGERRENWSLSVGEDHGKILVKCFANCTAEQIAASVGLTTKDLVIEDTSQPATPHRKIEKTYDYTDEFLNLLYQVVRYNPKAFVQRRPDGRGGWIWSLRDPQTGKLAVRLVLYHLPEVLAAVKQGRAIFIVEGEKDVETLRALGCVATCNPMGAGKWHEEYSESLRDANIVLIPDNDDPGRQHAEQVGRSLYGKAKSIRWLALPGENVKDTTDWVEKAGGTKEQLQALIQGLEEWRPAAKPQMETEANAEAPGGARSQSNQPVIETSFRYRRDITGLSLEALIQQNQPPVLFVRSGQVVRLKQDEHGLPLMENVDADALSGRLDRCANFVKTGKKGNQLPDKPPLDVVKDILSLGEWPFPPLLGITETPAIRQDGSILCKPGYDRETELYYFPTPGLILPPVPDKPSREQVEKAVSLLQEIICDFPFADAASQANTLATMMTPVLRPIIRGPVPLALFDKPQPGTGGSKLADIVSLIATGRPAAVMTAPDNDEDWKKSITSMLLQGRTVVVIDNIEGKLFSSSLAAILTQSNWQDRILGKSEMVVLPHKICWIGTGNNIRLGGDLPRRCYWIRLDAKEARPWQRKKFKHPELIQWVTDNRGRIIVAILTVAMAWMQAGRPQAPDLPVLGSFENWVRVIGDLLHYIGIEEFLNNLELMYETADDDTPQWEAFITTWHQLLGEAFLTVPELVQKIQEKPELATALPLDLIDSIKEKGFTRKLGKALSHRSGVQFTNQLKIQKGKPEHKALTWAVKPKDWEPPQAMKLDLEV